MRGTGDRRGSIMNVYPSVVAVVERCDGRFELKHMEKYGPATRYGILNTSTSHGILLRLDEYDDTVESRYGTEDIYVVNYQTHASASIEPFSFSEGYFCGAMTRMALSKRRQLLAFVRIEYDGWLSTPRAMAFVYDLTSLRPLVRQELKGVTSVRSIEFDTTGRFILLIDQKHRECLYKMCDNVIALADPALRGKLQFGQWDIGISFAGRDRDIAERIATELAGRGFTVFYDNFEKTFGVGRDISRFLYEMYTRRCERCLVLVSRDYTMNKWPRFEFASLMSIRGGSRPQDILLVQLDETELAGVPPALGAIKYSAESPECTIDTIEKWLRTTLQRQEPREVREVMFGKDSGHGSSSVTRILFDYAEEDKTVAEALMQPLTAQGILCVSVPDIWLTPVELEEYEGEYVEGWPLTILEDYDIAVVVISSRTMDSLHQRAFTEWAISSKKAIVCVLVEDLRGFSGLLECLNDKPKVNGWAVPLEVTVRNLLTSIHHET